MPRRPCRIRQLAVEYFCTCSALRSGSDFFASSKSAGITDSRAFRSFPTTIRRFSSLWPEWCRSNRGSRDSAHHRRRTSSSCQKCFRGAGLKYDDIASVGDPTHHTFFEMLGNWSIGHYFKEGAIDYAWEFSTEVLGLDADRLWPSIYPDDAESERLWTEKIGVPKERISRLTGELVGRRADRAVRLRQRDLLTTGAAHAHAAAPTAHPRASAAAIAGRSSGTSCSWSSTSSPTDRGRCCRTHGRHRAWIRSDRRDRPGRPDRVRNRPLRADGRRLPFSRRVAVTDPVSTRSLYVLADHLRGAGFLDLRRRASRQRGTRLRRFAGSSAAPPSTPDVSRFEAASRRADPDLVATMGGPYPELVEFRSLIEDTLANEEDAFARTLDAGTERLAALLWRGARRGSTAPTRSASMTPSGSRSS